MTKNKFRRKGKLSTSSLRSIIINYLKKNPKKRFNAKQLIKKLKLSNSKDSVAHVFRVLEKEGILYNIKEDHYKWNNRIDSEKAEKYVETKEYTGTVDLTRSGAAYIVSEESEMDIYVPAKFTRGAFHGDTVKVKVSLVPGRHKPEGRIVEIIKRKTTHVVGIVHFFHRYASVIPVSNPRLPEVHIKNKDLEGIEEGSYAIAEITDWGINQNKAVWGNISKVLKEESYSDISMQSIIFSNGFEIEFPQEVIDEVARIPETISEIEIEGRRDFRDTLTITIDPESAKDFDDALSLKYTDDHIEVGVHIADVTHYLREGTALDKEALERSTSVYLVDRVIPMLPEKLSNNLCSLNPHVDRLVFSAAFTFDKNYKLINKWFGKGVIHSDRRFTYEEAQEVIEKKSEEYQDEIWLLNDIALHLRKERFKNGSITFESEEVYFQLDENAKPVSVEVKERKEAHMMIEDFMLLANKKVAEYISLKSRNEIPFVYRVHDSPDPVKLADFALFASELGVKMQIDTPRQIADSFNALAEQAREDETLRMLEPLAIRTMAKAEYTSDNIGHYGLAFDHYSHFTSPIRRYADVLVHRILEKNLESEYRVKKEDLEKKCKYISSQERRANDAERESVKFKQVEYVLNQIGQIQEGYVSGIIEKGIFVVLNESRGEGLVSFSSMKDDYIVPDSRLYAIGRTSKTKITMGDRVTVKILDADLETRLIDMELIEK
jgi:ribonuclease R